MFDNPHMDQPFIPCRIEQIKPHQIYSGLLKVTKYGISIKPEDGDLQSVQVASVQVKDSSSSSSSSSSNNHQPFWLHSLLVSVDKKVMASTPSSSRHGSSLNLQQQYQLQQHQRLALYITYRNFTALRITFRGINGDRDALQVWSEIQKWMNATSLDDLHCFCPTVASDLRDICMLPLDNPADPKSKVATAEEIDAGNSSSSSPPTPWFVFDVGKDFARMGLGTTNTNWRISTINQDYELIPTYPALLGVPFKISDNTLRHIAKFRSKGRIPSLSYLHPNKYSITRSAQPLVGWKSDRSIQDEKHIEACFKSHLSAAEDLQVGKLQQQHLIIDARPIANAMAQTALGAGTEPESHYPFCKLVFLGIENIHVVRDSFSRLYDACVTEDGSRVSKQSLDKSGWLKHIKTIVDGALLIVQAIHIKNTHVLIHCSDGWDRTAQLSSLAQICLDPYYRTIGGLMVLLEKEWCSFGHKFKDRLGHLGKGSDLLDPSLNGGGGNQSVEKKLQQAGKNMFGAASKLFQSFATPPSIPSTSSPFSAPQKSHLTTSESISPNNLAPKELSPVFPQFLDCLYQIWKQYPTAFEYDERMLEFLFLAVYSCSFGNFLFNNEKEAKTFRTRWSSTTGGGGKSIDQSSLSVWRYISANRGAFVNPFYAMDIEAAGGSDAQLQKAAERLVLMPSSDNLVYWTRVYRLTKHNYAEEDALLVTTSLNQQESGLSMESLNGTTLPKSAALDHLDPLVPLIGTLGLDIKHSEAVRDPLAMMGTENEIIDLQTPTPVNPQISTTTGTHQKKGNNDSFIENPLMSNPWA